MVYFPYNVSNFIYNCGLYIIYKLEEWPKAWN
nr:hypothetical protein Iba_chr14cCG13800 [Ipomoea batatas]